MTIETAKEVLLAFRPGVDDTAAPEVAAALALCQSNPELQRWYEEQVELQQQLRAKFRAVRAPEGLREQILSERRSRVPQPWWQRRAVLGALAGMVLVAALASIIQTTGILHREDQSFEAYRQRMIKTALRDYNMPVETNDLSQVRAFLAAEQSPDFELTPGLTNSELAGCGLMRWQGKPVSMICFKTGKPLKPGNKSDLFLFVIARVNVAGRCPEESEFAHVSELATVSWRKGDRVYILAGSNEAELKQLL